MMRFAGRYALLRRLGQGGMGTVHLALDLSTGAECALKRLDPHAVRAAPDSLRREFELLARVRHPAVVAVHELGFAPDGTPFYTMEYVPGLAADQALARGDWRAVCFVAAQAAHGLEALHSAGVLHGDLKPSNLLVIPGADPDALPAGVRLLDFGLAALLGRDDKGHRGTAGYAAPEVVRGEVPTIASDLYGLGATLYTLASGQAAFGRRATGTVLRRQQEEPPAAVPLEEAGTPEPLVRLILRLMAPAAGERPGDAREVRRELERIHPAARRSLSQRLQTERVVGRERELARLERWMARAPAGPGVLLLSGEAGTGKSALLGELAVRATLGGRFVARLSGAAFDEPGAVAGALWRRLAADAGADGGDHDRSRRALALLERYRGAPDEADLAALADAAVAWLQAIHQRGPAPLVLLDDCERLDALSRALIRRAALHPGGSVARWVWAGRPDAPDLPEDDRVLLDAGRADWLVLGNLERADAERLVATRLLESPARDLAGFLWQRSGGHPGLLVELLNLAVDRGALREGEIGLSVEPALLETLAQPGDFESARLARLVSLPESARAAAMALALWGRPAAEAEIRALAPAADVAALDCLVAAGLASVTGAGNWTLSPPRLATSVLAALGDEERRGLHRAALTQPGLPAAERFTHLRGSGSPREALAAAAEALAEHPDAELAVVAAALAESAVPDEAAAWQARAGGLLIRRGRHKAAIPWLERALEGATPDARPGLWNLLGTACIRAGRPADVERVVRGALAEDLPTGIRALVLCHEGARLSLLGQLDAAEAVVRDALELARSSGDDEVMGTAALSLGGIHFALGRSAEAAALARQAEEACARGGHHAVRVRALGVRAGAAAAAGDVAQAERLYREALDAARERGLRQATEELLTNLAVVRTDTGRWAAAREANAEVVRIALEDGRARAAALALVNLAQMDGLCGRGASALREARAALRLAREYVPRIEPLAWLALSQVHRTAGRSRRAERAARRALALTSPAGSEVEIANWCRIEYARVCMAAGRWKEAEEVCGGTPTSRGGVASMARILLVVCSGRVAVRRRDHEAAAARAAEGESLLAGRTMPYAEAHLAQLRAESALTQGRLEEGTDLVRHCLALFGSLPAPADRAAAALESARLALAAGAGPGAPVGEWLQDAVGGLERLGDHAGRARALALTVEWLRRPQATGPVSGRDRDLIRSVSRLLDSLADLHELSQRAMRLAVEQLDAERGVLLLADPQTGSLEPVVEHGAVDAATRDRAIGFSRRVVERVAHSGGSLLIGDAPSDPEALSESVVNLGLRSIVCVPLYVRGHVVGAVYLDDSRHADAFSDADRGLLEGFAQLMAVAIEKSRGHEEVRRANEQLVGENLALRREVGARFQPRNFIGASSAIQKVLAEVERAAQTTTTVLVSGENGTGKEAIARILHHSGKRREKPFVVVNCGAIPETLLESELFGILPNVATGVRGRDGRFVQADGGTLFLDEIGDMPLGQQVALLSVIANREITPVGGGAAIPVDVRIIAATNRDLRKLVEEGAFREDLYYRLNVIPIEVPPLRERKADLPALAQYFAAHFAQRQEREVPELSPEFLAALMQSDWPGNVRELQNYIERVMAMTPGRVLRPTPLPRDLEGGPGAARVGRGGRLADVLGELERRMVLDALERSDGNQSGAARELGLTEQSLRYRLRKYARLEARRNQRSRRNRR